jgi:hypothetical protein
MDGGDAGLQGRMSVTVSDGAARAARSLRDALDARTTVAGAGGDRTPGPRVATPGPLPTVHADGLSATAISAALATHGALLVRELVDPDWCARLSALIHHATEGRDLFLAAEARHETPGNHPAFAPLDPSLATVLPAHFLRSVARQCEAVLVAEAPAVSEAMLTLLAQLAVVPVIEEHLGEWPALSLDKWIARCVPPQLPPTTLPDRLFPGWHQDGATWPPQTRSLDLWITFDPAGPGTGAHGIELHPRPIDHFIPEAMGADWAGHGKAVEDIQRDVAPVAPTLEPGDALLFDHRNLHRSAGGPFTRWRTSVECWFFAPSTFPAQLTPMVLDPEGR